MTHKEKQEFTLRITQANKTQMIVLLYEMLLTYVKEARTSYHNNERSAFREGIRKARGCVNELMASLNFDSELAGVLLQLYIYVNKELAGADVRNEVKPLENVFIVVCGLHESFSKVATMDKSEAVMKNTQTVYAGLTYGKTDLNENLYDQGGNRGFFA